MSEEKKKIKTTESSTSGATSSGPPSEIDPLESSLLVSIEPEMTSSFVDESDTVKKQELEILLPKVIELECLESETLQLEVIQPKAPQLTTHVTLGPSSSLPCLKPNHNPYILDLTVRNFHLIL